MAKPPTKAQWLESIRTLLIQDYDYIQSCSISVVPESLKKLNEDAYIPRKVSIGPRFKGSREDLLLMEEVKLRCMLSLILRAGEKCDVMDNLEKCGEAVWELDEVVRASYVTHIELKQHELGKIMLLDGCFLLELLISKGLDSQLRSHLQPPGPAAEVLKDQDVLSDLMLLENQIPILVLHKLSRTLFPNVFEPEGAEWEEEWRAKRERRAKKINNLVLTVLGYSPLQLPYLEAPHILDVVHFFVNRRTSGSTNISSQEEDHVVVDIIDTHTTQTRQQQLKLKRCALRLLTSGVTLKAKFHEDNKDSTGFGGLSCFRLVWKSLCGMLFWPCNIFLVDGKHFDADHIPEEGELKGLDFDFKFEKGKLEIEQLHIKKTTKAMWCNLIAWEHHKKYRHVSTPVSGDENIIKSTTVSGGKFTLAALIFNCLICSADDVQLLKDKKIVVDHLKMSNEDLMKFFRTIALGVDYNVVDFNSYSQMVDEINNYTKVFFIKRIWKIVSSSFTYRHHGWLFRFMNRNYNFVATVISILTVVQTVYTILAYYFPK